MMAKVRIIAINDVYDLRNLPRVQTFLSKLAPKPSAVVLAGDFLSPSTLSSIDGGRGMVSTLRGVGLTHVCFGNHEADLQLPALRSRITDLSKTATLVNTNLRMLKDSESVGGGPSWLTSSLAPPYSIITSPCKKVRVALFGFISDEKAMFRDGTFRGVPISNVLSTFEDTYKDVVPSLADFAIPMTHQSMARDRDLAEHMLKVTSSSGVIIGGHEHEPYDVTVPGYEDDEGTRGRAIEGEDMVRIIKSGTDAENASLIDLEFELSDTEPPKVVEITTDIVDMSVYPTSPVVQAIVDSKMSVLETMNNSKIVHAETMLPPGVPLSSEFTRFRQSTVGAIFCKAIKDELGCDVAIVNGATIKGGKTYDTDTMTYMELKAELPFPTKMVVVPMLRWELFEAIMYSRTYSEGEKCEKDVPRRGYLQVDIDFANVGMHSSRLNDKLQVALPRNLLAGFCKIKPLMEIGAKLKEEGLYPGEDSYIPAIDLVVRYFCKSQWYEIVKGYISFEDMDLNKDGVLDRDEVKTVMAKYLGYEPPEFVVDDMISAVDSDHDGYIDAGEFSYLLATMEREDILKLHK